MRVLFTFTKSEKRGIFILLIILCFFMFLPFFTGFLYPQKVEDFSKYKDSIIALEKTTKTLDSIKKKKYFKNNTYENNFFSNKHEIKELKKVYINDADTNEISNLKGIGGYYAQKIYKYRERLGGFYDRKQLLEIKGIDSSRLKLFESQLIIEVSKIRKIELKDAEFKQLLKHPYNNYELNKKLFFIKNYKINNENEIIKIIGKDNYLKIRNYIIF